MLLNQNIVNLISFYKKKFHWSLIKIGGDNLILVVKISVFLQKKKKKRVFAPKRS